MIYTFYSYKGGVGRSMALANVAELFHQAGLKVLMVDWDLEAPGLERFFPADLDEILDKPGVMDMLLGYKKQMAQELPISEDEAGSLPFAEPDQFIVDIYPNASDKGRLWLLPAGRRFKEHFAEYAYTVRTFDWQDFYQNWEGELYFEWLRQQFEKMADVVLIDSRTGVTEMGGVCTYQLADTIVMFCIPNQQSIDGTYEMARNFTDPKVQGLRRGRPLNVLIIPARIERAESDLLDKFQEEFVGLFKDFVPWTKGIDIQQLWQLGIPYIPKYAYKEAVAVRESGRASAEDMEEAYRSLRQVMEYLELTQLAYMQPQPFIIGRPVPPEHFIGRKREIETILDRLANPAHASTAVSGEARTGKTSLLHYISSPEVAEKWGLSPEKCTFIFVDSQTIAPFSPMGFWHYVLKLLAARKMCDSDYIDGLLQGDDVRSFELGELFDRIARDGKLVVLLLDEFEHIVEHLNPDDPQFLYLLRALINRPAHGLALVLTSRKPLPVLCQNVRFVGSPFPTSFTSLSLGPFSPEEANKLIDVYTQGTGVTFSDRDKEFAYEISKGHPYWLQNACFKLFQRHVEKMTHRMSENEWRAKIAEEIAEELEEPAESARPKLAALPPLPSLSDLWDLLSRYPIAWFAIGVVVVVIITVLFFEPLCCVIEHRLTEATVALIAFLTFSAVAMTFRIAPPQTDKVLQSLYGGVAVTFIIVIIAMRFSPPPSKEDCGFATRVPTLTATPAPTYTMTPTSTETPRNTPGPTPTPTSAARATRVWESIAILSPSEGEEVSIRTHVLQ